MSHGRQRFFLWIANRRAVVLGLLACCLATTVGIAYIQGKGLALQNLEDVFDDRISSHKYFLLSVLGKYSLVPETIAALPDVKQALAAGTTKSAAAVNPILSSIADENNIDRLYVIAPNGATVASSSGPGRPSIVGMNYAFRPYFKQAMAGKTAYFTAIGISSPVLGFYVAHPVRVNGQVRGVIAMRLSLSLDSIRSTVRRHWENHSGLPLITDENGVVLMSPIPEWMYRPIAPLSQSVLQEMQKSQRYAGKDFIVIPQETPEVFNDGTQLVRFSDLPGRAFLRKMYVADEFGGRVYLHIDAHEYRDYVITYTSRVALAALAVFLSAIFLFQRWTYQVRLIEAAIHDPLTGLYTRLYMNEWLNSVARLHARNHDEGFALAVFDVDHFKKINDSWGHLAGDEVLKEISRIISSSIRPEDIAVRFGGEEIAVFIRINAIGDAAAICERIRGAVEASEVEVNRHRIRCTISCGIVCHEVGEDFCALFARADAKLYQAKESGRNRVCH